MSEKLVIEGLGGFADVYPRKQLLSAVNQSDELVKAALISSFFSKPVNFPSLQAKELKKHGVDDVVLGCLDIRTKQIFFGMDSRFRYGAKLVDSEDVNTEFYIQCMEAKAGLSGELRETAELWGKQELLKDQKCDLLNDAYNMFLSVGKAVGDVGRAQVYGRLPKNIHTVLAKSELISDIREIYTITTDEAVADSAKLDTLRNYGQDQVDNSPIFHPDFGSRMTKSIALNQTAYSWPRLALGWGAYAGLLLEPNFRQMVEADPSSFMVQSTFILGSLLGLRGLVDMNVLANRGWSPDSYATAAGLLRGEVDEKGELQVNSKYGVIGPVLDMAISFSPLYIPAMVADLPYSAPAYILACGVDQIISMASQSVFMYATKEKLNDNAIK